MSFNLVDVITSQIGDGMKAQIGTLLGDESSNLDAGIASAVPGLLKGLVQRVELPGGADALLDSIDSQDSGMLGSVGSMLNAGKGNELAAMGTRTLSGLFGLSGLGAIGNIVSSVSGLSKESASSLLGTVAPLIIGQLKKKMSDDGLNAGGLMSMLVSQQGNINNAMPVGMLDQFKNNNVFADSLAGLSSRASPYVAQQLDNHAEVGWMKKFIPVGLIAVLGVFGWNYFNGAGKSVVDDSSPEIAGATGIANVDVASLGTRFSDVFSDTKGALTGISDVNSARATMPKLNELSEQFGGLTHMLDKVPAAARGPLVGIISTGLSGVLPVIEKLRGIPGVGAVIDPVVEPLVEKLHSLLA